MWQRISYKLPTPSSSSKLPTQAEQPASDRSLEREQSDPSADLEQPVPGSKTPPEIKDQADMPRQVQESNTCQHPPSSGSPSLPHSHCHHDNLPCESEQQHGTLTVENVNHHIMQQQVSVWDYLQRQLQVLKLEVADETAQQLPFDFWGGFVGYMGYELKAECGGENAHQAPTPDAAMFLADRYFTALHLHFS